MYVGTAGGYRTFSTAENQIEADRLDSELEQAMKDMWGMEARILKIVSEMKALAQREGVSVELFETSHQPTMIRMSMGRIAQELKIFI